MRAAATWKSLAARYVPPPVRCYTDACEAPVAMWGSGAIPLQTRRVVRRDGTRGREVVKTYSHPAEVTPARLGFNAIDSMYCLGNEDLIRYFPEGLGGKVMQLMPPGHPRGFLYRRQSHLLNCYLDKLPFWQEKRAALRAMTNGRPGFIFDGPSGCGKSALLCQAVHYARYRNLLTLYIPNARVWTHGEWCWPSTLLPGFFDAPDAARDFLRYFAAANATLLRRWSLRCTPNDLPLDTSDPPTPPRTLYELCEWGTRAEAPASIDRQSVCLKYVLDELHAERELPIVVVVDGWNLFSHDTHFRYPHPDFLRRIISFNEGSSDIDLYPQELPRIPAARLSFVRGLNRMLLAGDGDAAGTANKFFITCTTRDFKPFDGVSGFADVEKDRYRTSLEEYTPYDAEKDSFFHPMRVENFTEYEYRAFLRFAVNSGELAGLGWGPMWHYASGFERKLYKIGFLSGRNPQRVIDHYHQELVWRTEYGRMRQRQHLLAQQKQRQLSAA